MDTVVSILEYAWAAVAVILFLYTSLHAGSSYKDGDERDRALQRKARHRIKVALGINQLVFSFLIYLHCGNIAGVSALLFSISLWICFDSTNWAGEE